MTNNNNSFLVNFRIRKNSPQALIDFLNAQSNISNSLRTLLEVAVDQFGVIDISTLTRKEINYLLNASPTQQMDYMQMQSTGETLQNKSDTAIFYDKIVNLEKVNPKSVKENTTQNTEKTENTGFAAYGFEDDD